MMTVFALRARGFTFNRNIPGFVGYCHWCRLYKPMDWWHTPEDADERGDVVLCSYCKHVEPSDEAFVNRFSVRKKQQRLTRMKGQAA